jgi:hypothetical protein
MTQPTLPTRSLRAIESNYSTKPRYPLIGSRWKSGFIERRDTDAGTYEAINSPCVARCEHMVQLALLKTNRRSK